MVIGVGLIGTGYVARMRASAFSEDARSHLVCVASGQSDRCLSAPPQRACQFARQHHTDAASHWSELLEDDNVSVVVVATVSALHGAIVEAALTAKKHVVVEYPLSLNVEEAARLIALSKAQNCLLHVSHIELLGGWHRTLRHYLPQIGQPVWLSYQTLSPKQPSPKKWAYHFASFGFPFCEALSRISRLTDLFGPVKSVRCAAQMTPSENEDGYFRRVISQAALTFSSGLVADVVYGKGEGLWKARREIVITGECGSLSLSGNEGELVTANGTAAICAEPRRGLLRQDTQAVLDWLTEGRELYVSVEQSYYALTVADALRRAVDADARTVL